jgi:hypothetical protein
MSNTIRVRAIDAARLPVPGIGGRFVGRTNKGAVIPEGVDVPDDTYHRRAIKRGELIEMEKSE